MYINKKRFICSYAIESFGVGIAVHATHPDAIPALRDLMPICLAAGFKEIGSDDVEHHFYYSWNNNGRDSIYDETTLIGTRMKRETLLDMMGNQVRLKVAEYARDHVFVHAGVVGWKGKAIMIPGRSFSGKTTLTAELVRRGALYYSDEYAIIDSRGLITPFPKTLSVRGPADSMEQVEHPVEMFGGKAGRKKIPVGLVVMTSFAKNGLWKPKILSNGSGLMEIIENTIPIRNDPKFTLQVLARVVETALVIKTRRGEATAAADRILALIDPGIKSV